MRLGEQALIVRKLAFELRFQNLIGPRIDLRQEVALFDHLPFGESDIGELTVDLGLHRDGRERRDGAERIDDDADIAGRDGCGADGLRGAGRKSAAGRGRRLHPAHDLEGGQDENDRDQPEANAEFAGASAY